jgi:hypothetical protein
MTFPSFAQASYDLRIKKPVISDWVFLFSGTCAGVGLGGYGADITGLVVGVTRVTGITSVFTGTLSATTGATLLMGTSRRISIFTCIGAGIVGGGVGSRFTGAGTCTGCSTTGGLTT